MTGEFELISRHFDRPALSDSVEVGIGDDAAVLRPTPGATVVVSTDTLVEGRHFRAGVSAESLGWKAAMVNLSDLAAMGAFPRWLTLALTLPEADDDWVAAFAAGFRAAIAECDADLVGGDITRGPLTIGVTALGECLEAPLTRRAARSGDHLLLTGVTGQAAAALALLEQGAEADVPAELLHRLDRPDARVAAGRAARGLARAAIDVSDGVLADLRHVLDASGVGARLNANALTPDDGLRQAASRCGTTAAEWMWAGGDDYELLVAVSPVHVRTLLELWREQGLTPVELGRATDLPGIHWAGDAPRIDPVSSGYRHF